mmetsp:Transcript_53398/g.134109  ORF Transcript_53398/g.134109 Transcript_53398/m.134109 type:complete len:101 (-) Transcript_53398:305-607(-)
MHACSGSSKAHPSEMSLALLMLSKPRKCVKSGDYVCTIHRAYGSFKRSGTILIIIELATTTSIKIQGLSIFSHLMLTRNHALKVCFECTKQLSSNPPPST